MPATTPHTLPLPPSLLRSSGNMHITVSSEKAGLYDLRMQAPPDGAVYSRRVSLAGASDGPPASEADGGGGYRYPGDDGYGGMPDMHAMVGGGGGPAVCGAAWCRVLSADVLSHLPSSTQARVAVLC